MVKVEKCRVSAASCAAQLEGRTVGKRVTSNSRLYSPPVLLILVALGLAIFGTIRLTRSLEPRQRVVAWFVFIVAVVWFFMKLVQMGLLDRATRPEP